MTASNRVQSPLRYSCSSSGSRSAEKAVNPARSANNTVTSFRSPAGASTTALPSACCPVRTAGSDSPQLGQNLAVGGTLAAQCKQRLARRVPQLPQDCASAGIAAPQLAQYISYCLHLLFLRNNPVLREGAGGQGRTNARSVKPGGCSASNDSESAWRLKGLSSLSPGQRPLGANLFIALHELSRKTNGSSKESRCEHSQRIRKLERFVYKLALMGQRPGNGNQTKCGLKGRDNPDP